MMNQEYRLQGPWYECDVITKDRAFNIIHTEIQHLYNSIERKLDSGNITLKKFIPYIETTFDDIIRYHVSKEYFNTPIGGDWKFVCNNLWVAMYTKDDYTIPHSHYPATYSACYYVEVDDGGKRVKNYNWIRDNIISVGYSSSQLKMDYNKEDKIGSRRVEFRVITDSESKLYEIIKNHEILYEIITKQ